MTGSRAVNVSAEAGSPVAHAVDEIPRIGVPTSAVFADYVRHSRPVVIAGALEDWPARRWSAEYFKSAYGDRILPVAPIRDGKVVYGAEFGVRYEQMRFGEWLDGLLGSSPPPYYAMFHVAEVLPDLADDLRVPSFCPPAPWSQTRFWMSPADTGSPMHQDLPDNLLAQVIGRKRIILVSPRDSWRMYRWPITSHLPQYSRVDAETPDFSRFPRFAGAKQTVVELGPGDLLYLPRLWWHQARSLDFSVSVNHWWATGWRYLVVRMAVAYQRYRRIRW
jgi:cupin-like protein